MNKQFISSPQIMLLLIGFFTGTAVILAPTTAIKIAGQDAWLAPTLGIVPALFLMLLLVSLNNMYPGQSLIQYSQSILGWPGKLLSLCLLWFALHLSCLVLRNISDFMSSIFLVKTPTTIIALSITLLGVLALRLGIETFSRTLCLLIILGFSFFIITQQSTLPKTNFQHLLPILGQGPLPVLHAAILEAAFPRGEMVLFGIFLFQIKPQSFGQTRLYLAAAIIFGGIIGALSYLRAITVLGANIAGNSSYAVFSAVNAIQNGNLLVPLVALNWFLFSVTKFIICYYAFVLGLAHWAKIKSYQPLIIPAGAFMTAFSLYVYHDVVQESSFAEKIWPVYAIPIEYGIPLLLWLAAIMKKLADG